MNITNTNMKSLPGFFFFITVFTFTGFSQTVPGKLMFTQGQTLDITLQMKSTIAQQAMGQAIDFNVNATGDHSYKVTNATEENNTLHHKVDRIRFSFDGMGQKMNFDSNVEKDMNGMFGKPVKDILEKKYDIILDQPGTVLMAVPEKIKLTEMDSRLAIITSMLKDVFDLVQPPAKGSNSFFKVLPDKESAKGEAWTESYQDAGGKYETKYTLADITDSTIVVDFTGSSITVSKAEMMGSETTTTMNNKSTGKIILNKATGIMKEKTVNIESNGSTEAAFGSLPVTSKTTITIAVKPKE